MRRSLGGRLRRLSPAAGRSRARGTSGRPRRRLFALVALVVIAAIAGGGYLWLRDSPLVAVERVTVTGLSGPDAAQIRASLTAAARGMTTLDVRTGTLRAAVSPYPVVAGIEVSAQFPHGLRIRVSERLPIAQVLIGGRLVPVAADGTLLHDEASSSGLPTLTLAAEPGGARLQDAGALGGLSVLAAAPAGVPARVLSVSSDYWHGIVVHLRQGPVIYFGRPDRPVAKWQAALAVLAAASTAGADYIDVTDPGRAAAGTNSSAGLAAAGITPGGASTAAAGATGTTAAPGSGGVAATGATGASGATATTTPGP